MAAAFPIERASRRHRVIFVGEVGVGGVREQRRNRLWARGAVSGALASLALALWQWSEAVTQRDFARQNLALAERRESLRLAGAAKPRAAEGFREEALGIGLYPMPTDAAAAESSVLQKLTAVAQSVWAGLPFENGRRGHADAVSAAAFSPDGTRIVTVSDHRKAEGWRLLTFQSLVAEACRLVPAGLPEARREALFIGDRLPVGARLAAVTNAL